MKKFLTNALTSSLISTTALAGNWFGAGPWPQGTYYPGQLDGKYQAAVYGDNITGVLGFAITDGAPPFSQTEEQTADFFAVAVNTAITLDKTQNYFAIFAFGRTYTGETVGAIDVQRNTVTGALNGIQPTISYTNLTITIPAIPDPLTSTIPIVDNSFLLARGLSGGFVAQLQNKTGLFTFQGTGNLSSAAQGQTIVANPNSWQIPGGGPADTVNGFNIATTDASIVTQTVPFGLRGLKTSDRATNPVFGSTTTRQ